MAQPSVENRIHRTDDSLLAAVTAAKDRSLTVVFTNGVFDLLHEGHMFLLEECRRLGGFLVVAVNSDASTKRLKGSGRPLMKLEHRLRTLASLAIVDAVVAFDEDTPLNLIMKIAPQFIVKGDDYAHEDVVGFREAVEWGGSIVTVTRKTGISTTALVADALRSAAGSQRDVH